MENHFYDAMCFYAWNVELLDVCLSYNPLNSVLFQPLEDVIFQVFILSLLGCPPPCDNLLQLFALPVRWGGLGIFYSSYHRQ